MRKSNVIASRALRPSGSVSRPAASPAAPGTDFAGVVSAWAASLAGTLGIDYQHAA